MAWVDSTAIGYTTNAGEDKGCSFRSTAFDVQDFIQVLAMPVPSGTDIETKPNSRGEMLIDMIRTGLALFLCLGCS